jgi:hypothetical protein
MAQHRRHGIGSAPFPNALFPQSNNLIPSVSRKDRSAIPCSDGVLAEWFLRTTLLWSQDVAEFAEEFSLKGKVETC